LVRHAQALHERQHCWLGEQLRSVKADDESWYGEGQRQDDDDEARHASDQQPATVQCPGRFALRRSRTGREVAAAR
jgi:hypothetical protein